MSANWHLQILLCLTPDDFTRVNGEPLGRERVKQDKWNQATTELCSSPSGLKESRFLQFSFESSNITPWKELEEH